MPSLASLSSPNSEVGPTTVDADQNDFEIVGKHHDFPLGKVDIMNLSFEAMQTSLTRYKLASYPPDILINIPKHVCTSFDYHKAAELIQLGRELTELAIIQAESTN